MANSTINTKLNISTSATYAAANDVAIKTYPDILGQPERIDVTTMSDSRRKYVPGVLSSDNMSFTLNYDAATFARLKGYEAQTNLYFRLTLPDGHYFSWQGTLKVGFPGKGVNDAIEFTVNVEVGSESDVSYT